MQKSAFAFLTLLVFGGLIAGCGSNGPETVKVCGIVTLDGKPVEDAAVGFARRTATARPRVPPMPRGISP